MSQLLGNRYEMGPEISKGEMGDLFVAYDQMRGGKKVALKVIANGSENGHVDALKTEYTLLSQVSHPNVVKIYDFGVDEEKKRFYFSEEFVEGEPLNRLTGKLSMKSLVHASVQIFQALSHLHDRGIVHGDIKPSNILLTADRITVVDFGLARRLQGDRDRPVGGTFSYLSPEVLSGETPSPRSDLYSVGILLFELSTGQLPFAATDFFSALKVRLLDTPPHPSKINPSLSPEWAEFILHLLNKDPLDRPKDASEALRELNVSLNLRIPVAGLDSRFNRLSVLPLVGREETLQALARFPEQDACFVTILQGSRGLGKSRLLSELKKQYETEHFVVAVSGRELPSLPALTRPGILLVDDFDCLSPQRQLELLEKVRRSGSKAVVSVSAWPRYVPLSHDSYQKIILKPLFPDDTIVLAKGALGCRIPQGFGGLLHELTGGNPSYVVKMTADLMENHLIPFEPVDKQLERLTLTDLFVKDPVVGFRSKKKTSYVASLDSAIAIYEERIREGKKEDLLALAELYYEKGEPGEVLRVLGDGANAEPQKRLLAVKATIKMGDFARATELLVPLDSDEGMSPSERASSEMSRGIISFYRGENQDAIRLFLRARESYLEAGDPIHAASADNSLGNVYARIGQEKRAVRFYTQALKRAREIYDVIGEGSYQMNIGNFHHQTGDFEEAVARYCDSLNRFRAIGYRFEITRVLTNLANTHLQMGHVIRAKELVHEAILEAQEKGLPYQEGYAKLVRGDINAYDGDRGEATISYLSARELFSRIGTRQEEMMARVGLMRCAVEAGDLAVYQSDTASFHQHYPKEEAECVSAELEGVALAARFVGNEIAGVQLIDEIKEYLKRERRGGPKERAYLLFMERLAKGKKDLVALNWIAVRLGRWVYALSEEEKPKLNGKTGWVIIKRLQAIHSLIVSGCPSRQVIDTILQEILEVSKSDRGLLILKNGDSFRVDATYNLTPSVARELGNRISTTITQGVFSSGLPSAMGETEAANPLVKSVFDLGLKSVFCLPLNVNDDTIGVIYADSLKARNVRGELPVLQAFADLASVAILHTKLLDSLQSENELLRRDLEALTGEALPDKSATQLPESSVHS